VEQRVARERPDARREGIEAVLDRVEKAIGAAPDDDGLRLELATAQAAFACALMLENGGGIEFWLADAARNLGRVSAPALRHEARALAAVVAWYTSDAQAARAAATEALQGTEDARRPDAWLASNFFDVLLQLEAQAAYARAQQDETANLAAEVARTLTVVEALHQRGAGLERGLLAGAGVLEFAGLRAEARRVLERLVLQFPASLAVHNRWRDRMMIDLGAAALRTRYAAHVAAASDTATAEWYAGYAALVCGDRHTLDVQGAAALEAYSDAIERLGRSAGANADYADSANHYAAFALAGRALLRHQRGQSEAAVADLLRAAALRPDSMDQDDALQRKPRGVARRVHDELEGAGRSELAAQLKSVLR
jgi:tetratricopeptide (TPR) repeat protein